MSLKRNIFAYYISQIYVTLVSIVMVPLYIRYMGTEAYGLVGFFSMLQSWFSLLDMGLTPTMARETARFRGGATDALSLHRLLRALEGIFLSVSVIAAAAMLLGAGVIARHWLKVQKLPLSQVQHAIMLMAVIVAIRLVCGLYRGVINGFEHLVWLSSFNIVSSTIRYVFVIPIFIYIGTEPEYFFWFQLIATIIEILILLVATYKFLPQITRSTKIPWQWEPLRKVLKFSLGVAFTSSVWILITQTDKLLLSKLVSLVNYSYFTVAVLMASGVTMVSMPITVPLLPRLTKLNAENDQVGFLRLYRNSTQIVAVIALPVAIVLAQFSKQALLMWTGNPEIAAKSSFILTLYALGNGFLALSAFPSYIQYAKGDLKLLLYGNTLFLFTLIPSLFLATTYYGVIGAGYVWLGSNLFFFLCWTTIVHGHFYKALHSAWLVKDVAPIMLSTFAASSLLRFCFAMKIPGNRFQSAIFLAIIGLSVLAVAATASSFIRNYILAKIRKAPGSFIYEA